MEYIVPHIVEYVQRPEIASEIVKFVKSSNLLNTEMLGSIFTSRKQREIRRRPTKNDTSQSKVTFADPSIIADLANAFTAEPEIASSENVTEDVQDELNLLNEIDQTN